MSAIASNSFAALNSLRRVDWHATGLRHRRDEPTKVTNYRVEGAHAIVEAGQSKQRHP
jgi:hypothetical protein